MVRLAEAEDRPLLGGDHSIGKGDVALSGAGVQTRALQPHFQAMRLAVEGAGCKSEQVLASQLLRDPRKGRRKLVGFLQFEIPAAGFV